MSSATPLFPPPRSHWVIAELDAHGEIDRHALMCLRQAIDAALSARQSETLVIDLRDLVSCAAPALVLLLETQARCRPLGIGLSLLLSDDPRQRQVVRAVQSAGLHELQVDAESDERDAGSADAPARLGSLTTHRRRAAARTRRWARRAV